MNPRPKIPQLAATEIIENLATGIVFLDNQQNVKYLNQSAESDLRVSARQISGQPLSEYLPYGASLLQRIANVISTGENYREWEHCLTLGVDTSITLDYSISKMPDGGGVLLEFLAVDQQLHAHQEEKRREQQLLSQEVVRGLAHEIKNPLGGLRGAAQLLERELKDPELAEFTQIITREADRLTNLVDQLLGPTRLPQDVSLNVHEVIEHVRQLVDVETQEQDITLERDFDPSIPDIIGDREQLTQALLNIVKNGVQALKGHGLITIRSRAQRQVNINGKRHKLIVRIDVVDNGPGVPDDMQEKIFYPMVTGRAEGTGLGLAIAQSICVRHGGTILLESAPGKTCFSLLLPIRNN